LMLGRGAPEHPPPHAPHAPHAGAHALPEQAPALPPAPAPGAEPVDGDLGHEDDLGSLAESLAALPEPPAEDDVTTRPERQPLTPEEQRARRRASIDLLDRHIER